MDPVKPYLEAFEALRRRKRWSTDTTMLRFAALTIATLEAPDLAESLERTARELRAASGWFSPLRSNLRRCDRPGQDPEGPRPGGAAGGDGGDRGAASGRGGGRGGGRGIRLAAASSPQGHERALRGISVPAPREPRPIGQAFSARTR